LNREEPEMPPSATKGKDRGNTGTELSSRERLFIAEFLTDGNATRAARAAGFPSKQPGRTGFRLLKKPLIAAEIGRLAAERERAVGLDADRVLRELAILVHSSVGDFTLDGKSVTKLLGVVEGIDPAHLRAVRSFKVTERTIGPGKSETVTELQLWDKPAAVALAMRHHGLLLDRLTLENPDEALARLLGCTVAELPPGKEKA
jgi:phage terminase small subunit